MRELIYISLLAHLSAAWPPLLTADVALLFAPASTFTAYVAFRQRT